MTQKTYGIGNLMDWKAAISAGQAKVIVHFTGGAITAYGVTPAEFTTSNAFVQRVIEQSSYFREGRIKLLRSHEIEEPAIKTKVKNNETSGKRTDPEKVKVTCIDDAVAYLNENFGIAVSKLRSKVAVIAAAKEKGIEFVGL